MAAPSKPLKYYATPALSPRWAAIPAPQASAITTHTEHVNHCRDDPAYRRTSLMKPTDLPSLNHLRAVAAPEGAKPFHVGIIIGPGFVPMDMVGVQTVLGLMPGGGNPSPVEDRRAGRGLPELVDQAYHHLC
ncbi:protein of unknown function [Methylocella tundrae]|uniref:Uncharacterized protein n=1 Tax=Methylocella tundrae TaxID=227605 RepID=A0A4U8Z1E3_METTU|nr:protein of unknown function [Methylocella tundrae]